MRYFSQKINAIVVLVIVLMLGGCQKEDPCNCEVPRACCRGLVPECAACEEGLTVEDWLKKTCPNGENDAYYGGWDDWYFIFNCKICYAPFPLFKTFSLNSSLGENTDSLIFLYLLLNIFNCRTLKV